MREERGEGRERGEERREKGERGEKREDGRGEGGERGGWDGSVNTQPPKCQPTANRKAICKWQSNGADLIGANITTIPI